MTKKLTVHRDGTVTWWSPIIHAWVPKMPVHRIPKDEWSRFSERDKRRILSRHFIEAGDIIRSLKE